MARRLTLKLEVTRGRVHDLSASVGGELVISGDGTRIWEYTRSDLPDTPVKVRVTAIGVPGSEYTISVDLPDDEDDFDWKYMMDSTVQEVEFDV